MSDKWISVEERMPEYEVRVLTLAPKWYFCVAIHCLRKWCDERGTWWIGENNFYVSDGDITHWMPLPSEDLEV